MRKIKHRLDSKGTKDKIIELFFEKHLKPVDISKKLGVKMPYITKIIQKDWRYIQEKEARKQDNKKKTKNSKTNICTKQKRKRKARKTRLSNVINTNKQ